MPVPAALLGMVRYGLARSFAFAAEDGAEQDLSGGSFTASAVEHHGHWVAEEVCS